MFCECARSRTVFQSLSSSLNNRRHLIFPKGIMTRSISVFGLGYVGSVSAACFAKQGFPVIGVDLNRDKVQMMASGRSPILEPGMSELTAEAHKAGLLDR